MEVRGLSEFQRSLLNTSNNVDKEIPKILRKIGSKGRTLVAKIARSKVKKITGNYQKGFKRGKAFRGHNGEWVIRIYNNSAHGHLLEDGFNHTTHEGRVTGRIDGKHVVKESIEAFESSGTVERMVSDWMDDMLRRGKL